MKTRSSFKTLERNFLIDICVKRAASLSLPPPAATAAAAAAALAGGAGVEAFCNRFRIPSVVVSKRNSPSKCSRRPASSARADAAAESFVTALFALAAEEAACVVARAPRHVAFSCAAAAEALAVDTSSLAPPLRLSL